MSAAVDGAPEVWAQRQFANAELGDRRRTRRAVKGRWGWFDSPSNVVRILKGLQASRDMQYYGLGAGSRLRLDREVSDPSVHCRS